MQNTSFSDVVQTRYVWFVAAEINAIPIINMSFLNK